MAEASPVSQLVVIGASAGGVDALLTLVATLPANFQAPIVIAQHLDPRRQSHLAEILGRPSQLPVRTVVNEVALENGVIFVVPSNRNVEISDGHLRLRAANAADSKPSIDLLFRSAAQTYGDHLFAVILTGFGSDGADGARSIAEAGGTVIIQNPKTAEYPSMPQSLDPGTVDIVADLEQIGPILSDLLNGRDHPQNAAEDGALRSLLDQLRERDGIDFHAYRTPTIMRRLRRRVVATGRSDLNEYARYVRNHPEEHRRLINSFLIKVTDFFRDPELFDYLRERVLPEIIERSRQQGNELRFWSAGCATGEEAYSLAILLAEVVGDELGQFNVRIFATDVDNDAVTFARRGIYAASAVSALPEQMQARYFNLIEGEFEVRKFVRNLVIFGQHDLAQRAPFPRVDLVLCRNVLIYFTSELQKRALQLFAFALRDHGYLVLGKAETTTPLSEYFTMEDSHLKVYRRAGERVLIPAIRLRDSGPSLHVPPQRDRLQGSASSRPRPRRPEPQRMPGSVEADRVLLGMPLGLVIVDRRYDIQTINGSARRFLGVYGAAVGEDLIHLVQTLPSAPLRAGIDAIFSGKAQDSSQILQAELTPGAFHSLQFYCYPYPAAAGARQLECVVVTISDVTELVDQQRRMGEEEALQRRLVERLTAQAQQLTESNQQLLEVNEELSSGNSDLRSNNEELLIAAEEAQAATEEIETLNEELQATNEELETLNEELQATVEELNTTNDDMQAKSIELLTLAESLEEQRRASELQRVRLETILAGMSDAVLVVDKEGKRVLTNNAYTRLFGDADFVPENAEGRPLALEQTPQRRAARGERFSMEFTLPAPGGARRWFEANGQPVEANDEQRCIIVIRDITERSLRRLEEQFVSLASHELRTPLTPLHGCLDMLNRLLRDRPPDDPARHYAELALGQSRLLAARVDELLEATRIQSDRLHIERQPVELGPLIRSTIDIVRVGINAKEIRVALPSQPLVVEGDATRLGQVITNLISNAMRHAPESDHIDVRLDRAGNSAQIEVQDYSTGIAPENLPNLFSRFYQVERDSNVHSGLGLGLFICRRVVEVHGGSIDVQSTLGEGSIFTVRLPLMRV